MAEAVIPSRVELPDTAGPPAVRDFEIVPRRGLVLVAVVFAALVAGIAVNRFWPLEFLHVAFGAAWTIIDLFLGLVLGPIIGRMSIPARVEFTTRLMPKMVLIMPTVVTVTLAAGWQLGHFLGTVQPEYADHGWIVASYIVVGCMAVIEHLMKRFLYSAGILGVMQVATFVIMTKIASSI